MKVQKNDRPNEREYRAELGSIQWEIKCQRASLWKYPYQWFFSPVVTDLKQRASLIRAALRRPILPPLPDELRNPFDVPPTPVELEFIKTARQCFTELEEPAAVE